MNSFAYIVETASDKKNQKMPDQTCANGLDLDDMPKDLHDISPLERIISLHIPFITLIVMHQYGGHYKMNGPPVNVPTTLDHVIKILLHLPQQLQVKQLKLKQKLEYKSHYMDDMIQKDKIIGALTWLKQHNWHYADTQINADWCSSSGSCDLSVLLEEKHTSAVTVDINITDIKVVNGLISNVSCDGESTGKSIQSKKILTVMTV